LRGDVARARTVIPTKPDDARAQRSIEALRAGFLALIERKPLDQIFIKEITDEAGLSYPTFFRRFASKEDLLEHIAAEEVRTLLSLGQSAMDRKAAGSSRRMLEYVQDHRKLWTVLLTGGAASAMRQEFMRVAREIASAGPRINPWIPLDLAVSFVANGIFEILAWWMRQPADYPLENVLKLFDALIVDSTARPRNIVLT
jgi:AcrR family transcriptional regulator